MDSSPLYVALVWHMHQPWYRDDVAGQFVLPWVRRRAAKDYLHMLQLLERHPEIRVTMNVVPSLLVQLDLYAAGEFSDSDRDLCLRDATELTPAERDFLVAGAKRTDYGRRVAMLSPYLDLVDRLPDGDSRGVSDGDIRDLQLWTMLVWIDPDQIRDDPALRALARRGGAFTEADKRTVDIRQIALLRTVIPAFRGAMASGQVEPMTSPFHHPILPLLIDASSARVATPDISLPAQPLRAESDAEEQIRRGLGVFTDITGRRPQGMWPPECAVSPAAARLMHASGLRFAVSDELVLARTLGRDVRAGSDLYRPHAEAGGLTMVFRDAQLSNLIGFTYQSMSSRAAAEDLLMRLEVIAQAGDTDGPRLLTIALDGENFKDFYDENGTPFLDALYTGLARSRHLRSTHIGAFLDAHPEQTRPLPQLWTGSWVDADLRTWIGDRAHTRAWNLLAATRDALHQVSAAIAHPRANDELLIAEGSDWFWWFGEHHDSGTDSSWDALFRTHLRNAHTLAGLAVPPAIDEPVISGLALGNDCAPLREIDPVDRGDAEWSSAGVAEVGAVFGAMRPPASSVERILYGAGNGRLHLRFGEGTPRFNRAVIDAGSVGRIVVDQATPYVSIALPAAGTVDFTVTLEEAGRGTEVVPASGHLHLATPSDRVGERLRILIVAAECAPLAVAGQLAALVATTAADAAALGHDVLVVVPRHRDADFGVLPGVRLPWIGVGISGRMVSARVVQGSLTEHGIPALNIDAPALFDRPAVYGDVDDGERYVAFCALAFALVEATAFSPDIVHGFEWQSAPLLARIASTPLPPATVLSVGAGSTGYLLDGSLLAGAGVVGAGLGVVEVLDIGRRAATVVEQTPRRGSLAHLYRSALTRRNAHP